MDGEFDGYDNSEIAYVIELLAAMCTVQEVKKKFFEFTYPGKDISAKTIQKISLRFAKKIRERNEAYLRNIQGNPLAHQRVRLDILHRIIEDSMKQRPSHSVKIADDQYEVVTKADNPTAINAIKLAMTDLNEREKLDMTREKLKLEQESEEDFEDFGGVNDGIA